MTHMRLLLTGATCALLVASSTAAGAPTLRWDLLDTRPHDPGAFTQGLVAHGRVLLESTGNCCDPSRGESSIRRVDPRTGRVLAIRRMPEPIFAEGVTVLGGTAWQLTWQDRVAYSVSPTSLRRKRTVPYPREGWGITTQGSRLVASDGSARLRWLRTPDLRTRRAVTVRDNGRPIARLNELEMLNGVVWSNVWLDDRIALISSADGHVRAWLDMSGLRERIGRGGEALNGIARDPVTGNVIVTGKNWDRMFVIRLAQPVPG